MIIMVLSEKEVRVYKETRLRNLKRKYSKLIQYPEFIDDCTLLKTEIDGLEKELS